MLKITFKNVGQGDSIIIEWNKNSENKIGIIDCNILNNTNPALEYIIKKEIKEIEFIILSHPHYDHFSGLYNLLNHCKEQNIKVKSFLHTSSQVPSFLKMAYRSATAESELQKLFIFLNNNYESMGMNVAVIQGGTPFDTIPLTETISLKILSPTLKELNNYVKGSDYAFNEEGPHDNPQANWLSTVFKLQCSDGYILLTSDTNKESLIRIDKKNGEELNSKLLLGQIPHHGAFSNHNNEFWRKRLRRENIPAVISVGTNSFNHPSKEVIISFNKNNYQIFSTNRIGTLLDIDISSETLAISDYLNIYSTIEVSTTNQLEGDKIFEF